MRVKQRLVGSGARRTLSLINYKYRNMMNIRTSRLKNAAVILLDGRMDAASKDVLQDEGDRLLATGERRIAVDLSRLTYISSAGIGVLIRLSSLTQEAGGEMWLCGTTGAVRTVFEITRVTSLFRMFATVDEAVVAETL